MLSIMCDILYIFLLNLLLYIKILSYNSYIIMYLFIH